MAHHPFRRLLVALLLCATVDGKSRTDVSQPGDTARRSGAAVWTPRAFPISFWCGPPSRFLTLDRFREIKNAGFTHVQPPCGGATAAENQKILELCRKTGLKAFISDRRMPLALTGAPDARAQIQAVINDYKNYPALEGYSLTDEPGTDAFAGLGEVVAYLREKDPRRFAFINMLPNYASAAQMGVPTYDAYLRRYLEQVKPFALSYDHYHFTTTGDRPGFFSNLAAARRESRRLGIPFWNIVLCVQHGPYRSLSEGELRFEAMQTLAYGGKGLIWFTYWTPDDASFEWAHAMINRDGTRDPHYDMVRNVNAELRAFGGQMLDADCTEVFQSGRELPEAETPETPLDVLAGNVTVGLFQRKNGDSLALVASADYQQALTAQVRLAARSRAPQQFNAATGRWNRVSATVEKPGSLLLSLRLSPGGAALLRW